MSGGSRGIGYAIAAEFAARGGNVVLLAKTDTPDPRLPGTLRSAVADIESAGGSAVGVVGDVRKDDDVDRVVRTAVERFGGIDVCVNNASVLTLSGTEDLTGPRRPRTPATRRSWRMRRCGSSAMRPDTRTVVCSTWTCSPKRESPT